MGMGCLDMAGATNTTQWLANLAGGAIKDGGGGMEKGIEILCQQAAEKATALANKMNNQKTVSMVCYALAGLLSLTGIGCSIFNHANKKTLKNLKIYHDLIYIDEITSIKEISQATKKTPETVRKEIQSLIKKEVFVSVKIDTKTDSVVLL